MFHLHWDEGTHRKMRKWDFCVDRSNLTTKKRRTKKRLNYYLSLISVGKVMLRMNGTMLNERANRYADHHLDRLFAADAAKDRSGRYSRDMYLLEVNDDR